MAEGGYQGPGAGGIAELVVGCFGEEGGVACFGENMGLLAVVRFGFSGR